jgi:hypothetical protein
VYRLPVAAPLRHIRSCRETMRALREENRRLIETLARLAER